MRQPSHATAKSPEAARDGLEYSGKQEAKKRPLKILLLNTLYHPNIIGGAERSTKFLAESLVGKGHDVSVVTLSPGKEWTQVVNGVRVQYVEVRNLYWPFQEASPHAASKALWHAVDTYNPWMARVLGRILDLERPDVVNTHNIAGFSVAVWHAIKARGLPLVHTMRDQYLLCPRSTMFTNGSACKSQCGTCRLYAFPRMKMTRVVDAVTGISQFIIKKHLRYGCFDNATQHVIYNGYERPAGVMRSNEAGAHPGPLRFGYLGRLHPSKGVDRLIDAFGRLETADAELWIAGAGRQRDEATLKSLIGERRNVRWMGFVKPESLLSELDVLLVPSIWDEAFGRVVVEAFAFGVPVIGSSRGGIPELVTDETGWIFDPDEPGALSTALRRCLQERSKLVTMGASALERSQRFTNEASVRGYLEVYEGVRQPVRRRV